MKKRLLPFLILMTLTSIASAGVVITDEAQEPETKTSRLTREHSQLPANGHG